MSNKFFASGSNSSFDLHSAPAAPQIESKTVGDNRSTAIFQDPNSEKENIIVQRTFDVSETLEAARNWRQALEGKSTYGMEWRPVFCVDEGIVEQYLNINGITLHEFMNNPEHANRMMKDPNLAAFRILPAFSKTK